ncbi:hypothetical protein P3T18_006093 [Paraburkholderia sp. GAS199]|uniref:hypothetical protein n=1 Tax=Paraburkholderia sp. GAS199 TaxID=3035126 RepID=UPI003D1EF1D4
MAHADLAVLGGAGILSLACLFVCGMYVYWSSDRYRDRQRRLTSQETGAQPAGRDDEPFSATEATMGTQLSDRCKTSLYRAVFSSAHEASTVFLFATNRDDARKRATSALAAIHNVAAQNVQLSNLASFRELVDIGVSEDEDLRIFEMAWKGADVSAWAEHPLFLTDDPGLLGKWAELYADLARELAVTAIEKARD